MIKGEPILILLVEDDLAHAEIIRRHLGPLRVANRMVHVSDGLEAMDYLFRINSYSDPATSPKPDLILLDLRMPKMDGLELLQRIKAVDELKRIPTVVLTTSDAESDIVKAYDLGTSSYLVKPVDFEKFTGLMESFGLYWLEWNVYPTDEKIQGSTLRSNV